MTKSDQKAIYDKAIAILASALPRPEFDALVKAIDEDENAGFYFGLKRVQAFAVVVPGAVAEAGQETLVTEADDEKESA